MTEINLQINGAEHSVAADPATPLIYVLRNQVGLVGTKFGCGLEQCGACAVLVDGAPVLSCVRPVSEFEGAEIRTIEGLAADDCGREVQRVFIAENAAQCGYCTAGIVVATTALLKRNPAPDDREVRAALNDHLCRCGSHAGVLRAIGHLVNERRGDGD